MSFADIITATSSLIAIITGIAAFVGYMSKHFKEKQTMMNVMLVALITIVFLTASIALVIGFSRPVIAVNHYISPPLPGQTAQLDTSNNTVVVATVAPSPISITKTIIENKRLICVSSCNSGLTMVLDKIVINKTQGNMTWHLTITYDGNNGNTNGCPDMNASLYLEDPSGAVSRGQGPGTLSEETPLSLNQSLQEYTTIPLVPQPGVSYTLHTQSSCTFQAEIIGDVYQVEIFTF